MVAPSPFQYLAVPVNIMQLMVSLKTFVDKQGIVFTVPNTWLSIFVMDSHPANAYNCLTIPNDFSGGIIERDLNLLFIRIHFVAREYQLFNLLSLS